MFFKRLEVIRTEKDKEVIVRSFSNVDVSTGGVGYGATWTARLETGTVAAQIHTWDDAPVSIKDTSNFMTVEGNLMYPDNAKPSEVYSVGEWKLYA